MQTGRELDRRALTLPDINSLGTFDASSEWLARRSSPRMQQNMLVHGRALLSVSVAGLVWAGVREGAEQTPSDSAPLLPRLPPCSQASSRGHRQLQGGGCQGHLWRQVSGQASCSCQRRLHTLVDARPNTPAAPRRQVAASAGAWAFFPLPAAPLRHCCTTQFSNCTLPWDVRSTYSQPLPVTLQWHDMCDKVAAQLVIYTTVQPASSRSITSMQPPTLHRRRIAAARASCTPACRRSSVTTLSTAQRTCSSRRRASNRWLQQQSWGHAD